jgi:hypothetical protein
MWGPTTAGVPQGMPWDGMVETLQNMCIDTGYSLIPGAWRYLGTVIMNSSSAVLTSLIRIYNLMIELLFTSPMTYVGDCNTETSIDPPMHK